MPIRERLEQFKELLKKEETTSLNKPEELIEAIQCIKGIINSVKRKSKGIQEEATWRGDAHTLFSEHEDIQDEDLLPHIKKFLGIDNIGDENIFNMTTYRTFPNTILEWVIQNDCARLLFLLIKAFPNADYHTDLYDVYKDHRKNPRKISANHIVTKLPKKCDQEVFLHLFLTQPNSEDSHYDDCVPDGGNSVWYLNYGYYARLLIEHGVDVPEQNKQLIIFTILRNSKHVEKKMSILIEKQWITQGQVLALALMKNDCSYIKKLLKEVASLSEEDKIKLQTLLFSTLNENISKTALINKLLMLGVDLPEEDEKKLSSSNRDLYLQLKSQVVNFSSESVLFSAASSSTCDIAINGTTVKDASQLCASNRVVATKDKHLFK